KGDFFITVVGEWTQEEAATRVRAVFHVILKLSIIAMIPRKRATGPDDMMGTIVKQLEPKDEVGFDFMAGKRIWAACGKTAEFEAEMILSKKGGED
ncbi:unnamed protein product, partial [marine sediment metagenome]